MNTPAYLFSEEFLVDSFINNTYRKFLLKGLEWYEDILKWKLAAVHNQRAKQLSAERCAFKPLANFLLPDITVLFIVLSQWCKTEL